MKLEHAIIYVDAIIGEVKAHGSEVYIDDVDLKALEKVLSIARSEYMEEQAGADQKAYDEKVLNEWKDHDCCNCKHAMKGLFDHPCVECDGIVIRSKWEADL